MTDTTPFEDEVLRSLRRISRAIDLHSRKLASTYDLTGPQLVCLRELRQNGDMTPSSLAREVSLSHATVTGILSRLGKRGLIERRKSTVDKRQVLACLTDKGQALVKEAPSPLQERFVSQLQDLPEANRKVIGVVLEQIVEMMDAEEIEASPVLAAGPLLAEPSDVEEFMTVETPAAAPTDAEKGTS